MVSVYCQVPNVKVWNNHEDYLRGERNSDVRHEYVAGHIYAMVGASKAHNHIAGNLYVALLSHLRGGLCQGELGDLPNDPLDSR